MSFSTTFPWKLTLSTRAETMNSPDVSHTASGSMSGSKLRMPGMQEVRAAAERIRPYVMRTPLVSSEPAADISGAATIQMKLEMLQPTGSFKVRGAANRIFSLTEEEKKRGVITFSTGNHGRAVSYMAGKAGVRAVVCLSKRVPEYRGAAIRSLGAETEIWGDSQDAAEERYFKLMETHGYVPVVPFDDPYVIAGQGTIALEILEQAPGTEVLLVPLSGGGLLAGMAIAARNINPSIRVIGVSIDNSPVMLKSLEAGHPVELEESDTLADSLLGGIGKHNRYTLPLVRDFVDDHVVVTEDDLKQAVYFAFVNHGLIIEGASAAALGAVLSGKADVAGKQAALPITGRNVDVHRYLNVIAEEEKRNGAR
jgi:threonine dehydratase